MSESLLQQVVRRYGVDSLTKVLTVEQLNALRYEWSVWARPEQLLPDDKAVILLLAGRRFGKTRTAAEWVRSRVERGLARSIMLVAPTHNDLLTDMLNGPSGLITLSPPWNKPRFKSTDNTLNWDNGARAVCLSAEEPERTRGKEVDTVWCDEIAAWRYPETWDLISFCAGARPMRRVVTTTPKPTDLVRQLIKTSDLVVRGSTFDNAANLSAEQLAELKRKHEGTRLGRQELYAELLEDVEGALWTHTLIDRLRVGVAPADFKRIVVGVDPAGSAKKTADEAGIIVAGVAMCACKGAPELHGFVLSDRSDRYSPADMARKTIDAYHDHRADRVVAEDNFGGQIIADLMSLTDGRVAYKSVHASRGKTIRAEPVAALYEQGRIHHVGGFAKLEDEMTTYTSLSSKSPGRLDAMVWAFTELMVEEGQPSTLIGGASTSSWTPNPSRRSGIVA